MPRLLINDHFQCKGEKMPKIKTKSSAKKRFKLTATGKLKRKSAFTSHMMRNKPQSMKRKARGTTIVAQADEKRILRYLPNASKQRKRKSAEPNQCPALRKNKKEA